MEGFAWFEKALQKWNYYKNTVKKGRSFHKALDS